MNSVPQNVDAEITNDASAPVLTAGIPLYILLPLCALASTLICTGGWRPGLRSTLLGASLLSGVFLLKKLKSLELGWKLRIPYFMISGIIFGLLGASIIYGLELLIGSPTLIDNPYNQDATNLFLICPLYGFFMLGAYALAIKLSRIKRYFIVLAGAALANTFGLVDMVNNMDTFSYVLYILGNCAIYYIPCLGNCALFVFLWILCSDSIFNFTMLRKSAVAWIIMIVAGGIIAYLGFIFIGAMTLSINPARYFIKYKDTGFDRKLTGVIITQRSLEYYDCQKRIFCKFPPDIELNYDYNSNNKSLKVEDNRDSIEVQKIRDDRIVKKISHPKSYGTAIVVNDTVYYKSDISLFKLNPPEYDKPDIVLKQFYSYYFYLSPDEKFVAYYVSVNSFGYNILCIKNLESGKILAIKKVGFIASRIYWLSSLDDWKKVNSK
jgi:hypothetical protein